MANNFRTSAVLCRAAGLMVKIRTVLPYSGRYTGVLFGPASFSSKLSHEKCEHFNQYNIHPWLLLIPWTCSARYTGSSVAYFSFITTVVLSGTVVSGPVCKVRLLDQSLGLYLSLVLFFSPVFLALLTESQVKVLVFIFASLIILFSTFMLFQQIICWHLNECCTDLCIWLCGHILLEHQLRVQKYVTLCYWDSQNMCDPLLSDYGYYLTLGFF